MRTLIHLLLIGVLMALPSCHDDNDSFLESHVKDIALMEYLDSINQATRGASTVPEGECVIGALKYCAAYFHSHISDSELYSYFQKDIKKGPNEEIIGIGLDGYSWQAAWNKWFVTEWPNNQFVLIQSLKDKKIVACRIGSRDSAHAIVLLAVNETKKLYYYYDPVLGGTNHAVAFEGVYEPMILHGCRGS